MSEANMDKTRRNLIAATAAVGAAAGAGAVVPFVWSWWPSERAKAAGAPVEVDVSRMEPGEQFGPLGADSLDELDRLIEGGIVHGGGTRGRGGNADGWE